MEAQTCVRQLFPENRMEQKVRFLQKVDEQSLSMQNNAPSKLLSLLFSSPKSLLSMLMKRTLHLVGLSEESGMFLKHSTLVNSRILSFDAK